MVTYLERCDDRKLIIEPFTNMSINNVVLKENYQQLLGTKELPFHTNPDGLELLRYYTPSTRQSLSITLKDNSPQINIHASDGHIYLTNQRFVYITASQGDINTFLIDIKLSSVLQFTHEIKSPWFGANYWQFMFFSAPQPAIVSDGFPKNHYFEGKIQFNDGGLFDFIAVFDKIINDSVINRHIDEELPRYTPS